MSNTPMSNTPIVMPPGQLSNHVAREYQVSRRGIAYIAIAFPLILWVGGCLMWHLPLQTSMSAYYHASDKPQEASGKPQEADAKIQSGQGDMRNEFVGLLFALGGILILYKGFTRMEDYALNLAGVMAVGVAVFPMPWGDFKGIEVTVLDKPYSLHYVFAFTLFFCIGYVCIFRASDTLTLIHNATIRQRYRILYKSLGWAMIATPLTAFVFTSVFHQDKEYTFYTELVGIWVFAAYWLVKDHEISTTDADELAVSGELHAIHYSKWSPVRKVEIVRAAPQERETPGS